MLFYQQHSEEGLLCSSAGLHQPSWGQTLISCCQVAGNLTGWDL